MFRKRQPPPGSAPGAFSVPEHAQPPRIHVFDYTAEQLTEFDVTDDAEKLRPLRDTNTVTWIDIQGLGNESVRRQLMSLRRAVWPQREAVNVLLRESPFICDAVRVYLRDCYDHVVQIMDVLETYRETAASLMEVHLSSISNRTNEIMRVLTVVSSIFIPLTFIVGVYGMNFENMPELHTPMAYPIVWMLMIGIAVVMFGYFRHIGWIGQGGKELDDGGRERS